MNDNINNLKQLIFTNEKVVLCCHGCLSYHTLFIVFRSLVFGAKLELFGKIFAALLINFVYLQGKPTKHGVSLTFKYQ